MERPIIVLSGGFDPLHEGHVAMFQEAAKIGDIIVILNSDDWLIRKKGNYFMDWPSRYKVISNIKGVKEVVISESLSDVSDTLYELWQRESGNRMVMFANGGDRTSTNTPEKKLCKKCKIPIIFGLGGKKANSSSHLLQRWVEYKAGKVK